MNLEQLATRWAQIKTDVETLKAEEEEIKQQLSSLAPGNHDAGEHRIQVQAPRRTLNKKKIAQAFPAEQYPAIYSMQLDTSAVKKQIAPAVLEGYMDEAATPTIILK